MQRRLDGRLGLLEGGALAGEGFASGERDPILRLAVGVGPELLALAEDLAADEPGRVTQPTTGRYDPAAT
jgi:hypothetical protein